MKGDGTGEKEYPVVETEEFKRVGAENPIDSVPEYRKDSNDGGCVYIEAEGEEDDYSEYVVDEHA